jgi:hypothetical protein
MNEETNFQNQFRIIEKHGRNSEVSVLGLVQNMEQKIKKVRSDGVGASWYILS